MSIDVLFGRITPELNRIARKYEGYHSFLEREDLFQEMCIYLLTRFKRGVPSCFNNSYVLKGCEFFLLNFLRKNRERVKQQSLVDSQFSNNNSRNNKATDLQQSLDEIINGKMVVEKITNELSSKREKELLMLLLKGHTIREIGKKLNISHVMVNKIKKKMIEKYKLHEKLNFYTEN